MAGGLLHRMALLGVTFDHPFVEKYITITDVICVLMIVFYIWIWIKDYKKEEIKKKTTPLKI